MAILVTGGAGFIGSHVCDALLERGDEVICLDNFNDYYSPERKRKNIAHNIGNSKFIMIEADITDAEEMQKLFSENEIESVIHLAARAGVRPSLEDPKLYAKVNINGTLILLEQARKNKIKTFVFGSSSSVYGENKKTPFSEEDVTESQISPYAITKKTGEMLCRFYSKTFDMYITCLRFFTVYGPRGRPDMAPYKFTELIDKGKPIEMYGDGSSKRDYTYVGDIVSGILLAHDKSLKFDIINLGNGNPVVLKEFIKTIERQLGKKAQIIKKPMPKGDVPITHASTKKAAKLLGYKPKISVEEGVKKFIDWYKS